MGTDLALNINSIVDSSASSFVSTISQYQWALVPDSQLQAAKQALTKNDFIMKIAQQNPDSVGEALIKSAVLGLDLTEGKRQGWLIPRKGQDNRMAIFLQVGYKGVEAIHQRIGVIDRLVIRVVRKNDKFEWSGDDQEKPAHDPGRFKTDEERGEIEGAYAITYFPDGNIHVTVTAISEIFEKHRDFSDSWKSYQNKLAEGKPAHPPPWKTHEKAMVEKTMAFIASKQWPANIRNAETASKILETLHEVDAADYTWDYTQEQKKAFYEFLESEDWLGLYLFSKYVDIECYTAIFKGYISTIPRGGKGVERERISDAINTGEEVFWLACEAIEEGDAGKLEECFEGCLPTTKKLIRTRLNEELSKKYSEMS